MKANDEFNSHPSILVFITTMGVCQTVYHYSNIDSNSDYTGEQSEEEFLNFDINTLLSLYNMMSPHWSWNTD